MTIRKGEPWGDAVPSPEGLPVFASDAAAGSFVSAHRAHDEALPAFGVSGGDLARTMGGGRPGRFPGTVTRAPVDLLRVELTAADGSTRTAWAVAHVVARRGGPAGWWRGEVVLAMNAQFLGEFDVAPRSHPNDGLVDAVRVDPGMTMRTRAQARTRARTGTHLPHPQLAVTRAETASWSFDRPLTVWLDGVPGPAVVGLTITVEPDALIVHA